MTEAEETTFTWRIENAHLCWQKTGEELVSPTFAVDWLNKSSWHLCLYPRGIQGEDSSMSLFIALERKDDTVTNTGAKFELYLLAADGSKVLPEISEGFLSMQKNGLFGYSHFISWKTLVGKNGSHYLPDETLTLCCRIWCECERDVFFKMKKELVKLKAFARTRISREDIVKKSTIYPNQSGIQKLEELRPIMQEIPMAKFIAIFGEMSNHKHLTIGIDFVNKEKVKAAACELILVDESKRILFWKNKYVWHDIKESENIILSTSFSEDSEQYAPKELFGEKCLYLACRFGFTNGSTTQKIEKADYGNNLDRFFEKRLSEFTNTIPEPSGQTASDALKSLFHDPIFSDVTIKGRNTEFKVHEMILSPRSEYFKKLLRDRDRNTNLIQIHNEDDDTLKRVIYFLYTDTILDMQWEVAKRLYKASCKYKIELLNEKCCTFIKENLGVSNVSEIVVLTKNDKKDELKEYVKNFIIKNESAVFNSNEWIAFSKSNSVLAGEYMVANYRVKSVLRS